MASHNLAGRLRAYRGKSDVTPAAQSSADVETNRRLLTEHPLSGDSLLLPGEITADFQSNIGREKLLFFDLETTGLGSGEQVYPFLIGFATASAAGSDLTTIFAATPAGEEEILTRFIHAAEGKTLVSFNGKSFDLPLILRRATKYNLTHRLAGAAHIDLYHLIRRIYPEKPARLADAETRLLGFTRDGDLGGAEVAQAYFEQLRFGNVALREKILQHNEWDILTLVSLMQKVSSAFTLARGGRLPWAYKIYRDKTADAARQKELLLNAQSRLDGRDLAVLGSIFRKEKNYRRAVRHFIAAYRLGYANAVIDAVRALKRLGKASMASGLARYALAREDERVQRQLLPFA